MCLVVGYALGSVLCVWQFDRTFCAWPCAILPSYRVRRGWHEASSRLQRAGPAFITGRHASTATAGRSDPTADLTLPPRALVKSAADHAVAWYWSAGCRPTRTDGRTTPLPPPSDTPATGWTNCRQATAQTWCVCSTLLGCIAIAAMQMVRTLEGRLGDVKRRGKVASN